MTGFDFQETFRIFESEIEHNGGIYRRLKKTKTYMHSLRYYH